MKDHVMESERRKLDKILAYQLPHRFKKIGIVLVLQSVAALVIISLLGAELPIIRFLLKNLLLIGMLNMSLARENEEDEMIVEMRAKSYQLAFICAVIYALVQPVINYGVAAVISFDGVSYSELAVTQVLFFMLAIQLAVFHVMKRTA